MVMLISIILLVAVFTAVVLLLCLKMLHQKQELRSLTERVTNMLDSRDYNMIGDFQKYTEGEIAVLESQIGKLAHLAKEQAQRLEKDKKLLKDAMADMSHQLKTPMTSLRLAVSMLADEEISQEQRLGYVESGTQLLNRIDWLVSTLLKLSRLDAGTIYFAIERVDFKKLSEALICQVEIQIDLKGQELITDIQESSGFEGDFRWTVEAVLNILKNCVEHTPENGKLYLTMKENTLYSEIVIEDEGPGIRADERRRIFERFYRGEHASDGSVGIGLALSAELIHRQNGTVTVESRRDKGSRFIIRFYKHVI